jgi:hypothetical protein
VAGRLRTRRLELARQISKLAEAAVAEPAEVLRDLEYLAEPAATGMAQRTLLAGTPVVPQAAPAVTAPNS